MGMQTAAQIAIAKPAAEVFRWLDEPAHRVGRRPGSDAGRSVGVEDRV